MLHCKCLQISAALALLTATAPVFAADLEIEKNVDVSVERTTSIEKSVDVAVDKSKTIDDSFNKILVQPVDEKITYEKNVLAQPVAENVLEGTVTHNSVNTGGKALKQDTQQLNQASASGNALQGFRGVNAGGNVNAGANSLVQSSVSISAVVVQPL